MTSFPIHTVESAPADSKPFLQTIQQSYGFIPNLLAELAESPTVLKAVLALDEAYSASSLTPAEQQAVLLAVSVENGCDFCTSVHSFVARKVARMDPADIDALRQAGTLPTERLNVLAQFLLAWFFISAVTVIGFNLLADVIYVVLDPRIRLT